MNAATILAKPNQTLIGHLEDCLSVYDALLMQRGAFLCAFCERYGWNWDDVRSLLRFAVWFHDIGKVTEEWQIYIRSGKHRVTHTLVSFAVGLETIGASRPFVPDGKSAALLAILAHHEQLHDGAFREEIHRRTVRLVMDGIREHFERFRNLEPQIAYKMWQPPVLKLTQAAKIVGSWKERLKYLGEDRLKFKALYTLMLSLLKACDGTASRLLPNAGSSDQPQDMSLSADTFQIAGDKFPFYDVSPLQSLSFINTPNDMQQHVLAYDDERLILNAGCGEGKTAAALLFAQKWLKQNRIDHIIFTLPTKFTANNLFRDLTEVYGIPRELVGITHGDSVEFLQQPYDEEYGAAEADDANLMEQAFENIFYAKPVNISTSTTPPLRTHNLYRLLELSRLHVPEAYADIVAQLNTMSVATRYPEDVNTLSAEVTRKVAQDYLTQTKELLAWLKSNEALQP